MHKDPKCGCCEAWAKHLQSAGWTIRIVETSNLEAVRNRLEVPADLAGCHTAEIGGYVVEGHVPAAAIAKLVQERPDAIGLSAPGMPSGSPGMGGRPQPYSVMLFGQNGRRTYMRFIGSEEID